MIWLAQVTLKGALTWLFLKIRFRRSIPHNLVSVKVPCLPFTAIVGEQSGWVMAGTSSVQPTKDRLLRKWSNSGMLICVIFSKINPAIYGWQRWAVEYSGIIRRQIRWSAINVYRGTALLSEQMKWQVFRRIVKALSGFLQTGADCCVLTPKPEDSGHTPKRTGFRTT